MYAAQLIAVSTPRSTPPRSPESAAPEPTATSPTPAKESTAPAQKRGGGLSIPLTIANSPANTGVAPRIRPMTEAVIRSSA